MNELHVINSKMDDPIGLRKIYTILFSIYGPQHWWPGNSPFEIMVGAVLTQNTTWNNVERAIRALITANHLDPVAIVTSDPVTLGAWLRPVGYFNVKARRLQDFCHWYLTRRQEDNLSAVSTEDLRRELLNVKGIGPETADDILLYAYERPVFVIDAYTRRLFSRLEFIQGDEPYETLRSIFEKELGPDVVLYNEYHALIVRHAKETCKKNHPNCNHCALKANCPKSTLTRSH